MARSTPPRPSAAGGIFIVLGITMGVAVGLYIGEVTPGFLIGAALGGAAAIAVWLIDRR